jgi:NADH:ubiquinone oxidoreductase subunit F (NADH-binding)/NADH:ubiquinone oxidoreductase subunit E
MMRRNDPNAPDLIAALTAVQDEQGHISAEALRALSERVQVPLYHLHGLVSFYPHLRAEPLPGVEVAVCTDLACHLRGAPELLNGTTDALSALPAGSVVHPSSCLGLCERAPAVMVGHELVAPAAVDTVVDAVSNHGSPSTPHPPIANRKSKIENRHDRQIDPYAEGERYAALRRFSSDEEADAIIQALKTAGLRGMGGAGFPTGTKWEMVKGAVGAPKYVVCNADESEPGTFKDRQILEETPHLVLEGMGLAARIIGATEAILFLRHEYGRARQAVERELPAYRQVPGAPPIRIFDSPGGYICGEETALLEAIEGRRAEPRNKPPFPGTHGLFGRPTLINNVETFAWVPAILARGGEWYRDQGMNGGQGLKMIALSGDVQRPGVYEIPLGLPARELIDRYGGGPSRGPLKAFCPGGASAGFLPVSLLDTPLEFGALARLGSMLGSGAVVAIGPDRCMLDLALNLCRFFRNESCGKCVPCRTGSEKLVGILERFQLGQGRVPAEGGWDDVALINELSETMRLTSICGLGQIASAPFISALQHFPDEIMAHVNEKRCPAGVCPIG